MTSLDVVRSIDFEWAVPLSDVWNDNAWDVPELHQGLRAEFQAKVQSMIHKGPVKSPLNWILVGPGGAGKTHLLSQFRRICRANTASFVLVDMTDVRDFWESVLQGYLNSLQERFDGDLFQHQCLIRNVIQRSNPNKPVGEILSLIAQHRSEDLAGDIAKVLTVLHKAFPKETTRYQDVIRALICLNSVDFTIANLGMTWLQCQRLDPADQTLYGFKTGSQRPIDVVEALSWFMSLGGPAVIAFDQLDPIVAQYRMGPKAGVDHSAPRLLPPDSSDPEAAEREVTWTIVQEIAAGLAALRDRTFNSLTVVACIEASWSALECIVPRPFLDRFDHRRHLDSVGSPIIAEAIIRNRVQNAFQRAGFPPRYPTWPFRPSAFQSIKLESPRELLKLCEDHRRTWLRQGSVDEIDSFVEPPTSIPTSDSEDGVDGLSSEFERLRHAADVADILDPTHEEDRLAPLLSDALACLLLEVDLPNHVLPSLEKNFAGGTQTRPLHARLKLIFTDEGEREEHFSVRALQHGNARAFQARLKAAMTCAGIDQALRFRHLAIVRSTPLPGGPLTQSLLQQFQNASGRLVEPAEQEIRVLHAVSGLKEQGSPWFEAWLKQARPISQLALIQQIVPSPWVRSNEATPTPPPRPIDTPKPPPSPKPTITPPRKPGPVVTRPAPSLPLGRALTSAGDASDHPVSIPASLLEKHVFVVGGAGAGKTMFLRRLIEEAALASIPSLVIDVANDLAAFDDRRDSPPEIGWEPGDQDKARRFHDSTETVVWTPGREGGLPLAFDPLPNLAAVADQEDELQIAVDMAVGSLAEIVAPGKSASSTNKRGLLSKALRAFAREPGRSAGLRSFQPFLEDPPSHALLGVSNQDKLLREMSDAIKAAMETNPLLRSHGSALDPANLFGVELPESRTRVSVINFLGLPNLEAQRAFLNQLAMTLFTWIKQHSNPAPRPLRGLLIIDEAREFAPSQKASSCKDNLIRLAAQARKYHLGIVFATQNPKDIDNKVVSNCSTHVYGKVNSPAAIACVQGLLEEKGGSGQDVARLQPGQFYLHNAEFENTKPRKVMMPKSLSLNPANPLNEEQILMKAAASRARVQPRT